MYLRLYAFAKKEKQQNITFLNIHNTLHREHSFVSSISTLNKTFTVDETSLLSGHPNLSVEKNKTLFSIVYTYIADTNRFSFSISVMSLLSSSATSPSHSSSGTKLSTFTCIFIFLLLLSSSLSYSP